MLTLPHTEGPNVPLPFGSSSVSNTKTRFPHSQLMDILRFPCSQMPNAQNEINLMIILESPAGDCPTGWAEGNLIKRALWIPPRRLFEVRN